MNEKGEIRELSEDEAPDPIAGEKLVSAEAVALLNRMTARQRQRFFRAMKLNNGNEAQAMQKAQAFR